jgi:hypothetical protein
MLFKKFNFDDKESINKISIDKKKHSSTWQHYYLSYNYTLDKIFEKGLKQNYAFNSKARSIMFLLRHSFELCLKYNLELRKKSIPVSHAFSEIIQQFDKTIIPIGLINCIDSINLDKDGACYRYYRNSKTKTPCFSYKDQIALSPILKKYNSISARKRFKLGKICREFNYNNKMIQWSLTFHMGECHRLGQIRTQYDETIELLIEGILLQGFDVNRLLLPLLFLIRHSLELALKSNILELQRVSDLIKTEDIENEHSLVRLYNIYSNFLDKIDIKGLDESTQSQLEDYKEKYTILNDTLHQLDSNSRYFRYPVDKTGLAHTIKLSKFTLIDILKLYYFTDPFITFTNYVLQEYGLVDL